MYPLHNNYTISILELMASWLLMMSSNGTFSALLAFCAGNSPVTGEFPAQRPVTWSFDVSFDLRLNKRLSKQSEGWWFETPSRPLWRHCNVSGMIWYWISQSYFLISLLLFHFIMVIISIADIFMSMATPFKLPIWTLWTYTLGNFGSTIAHLPWRIYPWTFF